MTGRRPPGAAPDIVRVAPMVLRPRPANWLGPGCQLAPPGWHGLRGTKPAPNRPMDAKTPTSVPLVVVRFWVCPAMAHLAAGKIKVRARPRARRHRPVFRQSRGANHG